MSYEYFRELWEQPRPPENLTGAELWDKRADEWAERLETDAPPRERAIARAQATTGYLRENGLLSPGSSALDIGCATGLFTAAFSQTVERAVGVDVSPRMIQHAERLAKAKGLTNTEFRALDFSRTSPAELGWSKSFDLVMACITPAVTDVKALHNMIELSRGHCLYVSFVESGDSLRESITAELFDAASEDSHHWEARSFYAVFNLLFLEGYSPLTYYYRESYDENPAPSLELAEHFMSMIRKNRPREEDKTERIHEYLETLYKRDGSLSRHREISYGHILWDVNDRRAPQMN